MANKWKQAKEHLDSELSKAKNLLREKEFSAEAKEDLLKNLSEDEISLIQKNRRTESVKKAKESWNASKSTEEYKNSQTEYQENIQLRKKLVEKGISLEEAQKLLFGEESKKESKEKMKTPQLETENHKIDKWKSKKEKLAEWWKEEERPAYINGTETKIKVLKKELAKGAFVREYQDDGKIPSHLVGEQLFNWKAVPNLWLKDRLPTWENMQAMRWDTKEEKDNFLKNNFQKDWKNLFPGYWIPSNKRFTNLGGRTDCWLSDGGNVELSKDTMSRYYDNPEFGFSLRLLEN